MSEYLNKIKDWFSKFSKPKTVYSKGGVEPKKDWGIILTTMFFILVILALVAVYFYIQVDRGNLFSVSSEDVENEAKINKNLLDKTVHDINQRKSNFESVSAGSVPSDPSL